MPSTPTITPLHYRVRDLADLSWDISLASEQLAATSHPVDDEHLVNFWVATRGLANRWLRSLNEWTEAGASADARTLFEAVAAEILVGEMLLRLWSTLLSIQDRQSGQNNARAVLDLAIFNLQHVRHRLLAAMVVDAAEFAELDRLRRRCERWTDVLLGPLVIRYGHTQYAHDARRAWDFGEDASENQSSDIAARMLQSSFRTAFEATYTRQPVNIDHWATIIQGIDQLSSGLIGARWPTRWRDFQATLFLSTDGVAEDLGECDESAVVRSLRRIDNERRRS